jgi:hypothetical protein
MDFFNKLLGVEIHRQAERIVPALPWNGAARIEVVGWSAGCLQLEIARFAIGEYRATRIDELGNSEQAIVARFDQPQGKDAAEEKTDARPQSTSHIRFPEHHAS